MSRDGKRIIFICIVWLVGSIACLTRRNDVSVLLGFLLALFFAAAFFFSLVCIFREWRQRRWYSMTPLAIWTVTLAGSFLLIGQAERLLFAWSLPSYEAIVRQIEDGTIPVTNETGRILEADHKARLTYGVFAARDASGVLSVEFITELGFPVKHSGYLYVSSGAIEQVSRSDSRWPIRKKVRDKWYFVSD